MRTFKLIAAAAAALSVLAACNKQPGGEENNPYSRYDVPAFSEHAAVVTFEENAEGFRSIELTEGGRYVLCTDEPYTRAGAGGKSYFKTGSYSVSGKAYLLSGVGEMTLKDGKAVLKLEGGGELSLNASVKKAPAASGKTAALCRTWKVETFSVSVSKGGTATGNFSFSGDKSIGDVMAWFESSYSIRLGNSANWMGYRVTGITFSASGTVLIEFSEEEPYVGTWSWKDGQEDVVAYSYAVSGKKNQLIAGEGEAPVTINENGTASIAFDGEYDGSGGSYGSKTTFVLKEAV